MRSLIWFRRDLRVNDNRALFSAAKASDQLLAIYCVTPDQWRDHHDAPAKIAFWKENLQILKKKLAAMNVPLLVLECASFREIPKLITLVAKVNKCNRLYFNAEYEVNEKHRDDEVVASFNQSCGEAKCVHDRLLIEPEKVLTGQGKPYTVFTPFRNNWGKQLFKHDILVLPAPGKFEKFLPEVDFDSFNQHLFENSGFEKQADCFSHEFWPCGEDAALARLEAFADNALVKYDKQRDLPAVEGTSKLSPYLAAGIISPRQCLAAILQRQNNRHVLPDFSSSAGTWLNELIWRDFYSHVMTAFPRISKGLPFRLNTERVKWRHDQSHLQAWKDGLTGFPIVDAAMRQMRQVGWMHNRLRMIAAMFLSKDMLLDWREGERWFMQNLIDGDLAANNGGWQWSASTGTDAAPYFRIFNPFNQSKKFDARGEFIKTFCPELGQVSARALHDPALLQAEIRKFKIDYPAPVVDHSKARAQAMAAFK